jgi:hypothetical protein
MQTADYLSSGQVIAGILQATILCWQIWLAGQQAQQKNKQVSTYECDALYFEITKLMFEHDDLIDFYNGSDSSWDKMSLRDKRLYLLAELNYFHLAFVHREFKKERIDRDHWLLYRNWMKNLLRSNESFRKAHEMNKQLFESEFVKEVDISEQAPTSKKRGVRSAATRSGRRNSRRKRLSLR